jgi:hypothetical protein
MTLNKTLTEYRGNWHTVLDETLERDFAAAESDSHTLTLSNVFQCSIKFRESDLYHVTIKGAEIRL